MARFLGTLKFPDWALDIPEISEAIDRYEKEYPDIEIDHFEDQGFVEISHFEDEDGRLIVIEEMLREHEVGFDVCAAGHKDEVFDKYEEEEILYVRFPKPGEEHERNVREGEDKIEAQLLLKLHEESGIDAVLKHIEEVVEANSPLLPAVGDIPAPETPGLVPG